MNDILLRGLKVVNIGVNLPGPAAAARLHKLGAQLIKVEPPAGDPLERRSPAWYRALASGQQVFRLDLKQPEGREQLYELLDSADALLTSSRLASLNRLGLGWDFLQPRFPRLCLVAILGHPPPDEDLPGHDLTYQAAAGLVRPPHLPLTLLADLAGAEQAATAVAALLLARERGLGSGFIKVYLAKSAEIFAGPLRYGATQAGGPLGGGLPGYGLYRAREGWLAVAVLEEQFWRRLTLELNLDPQSARSEDLQAVFAAHPADYWEAWARERDLPVLAVR
jgi:alpha-methylacyl-CoA racemase